MTLLQLQQLIRDLYGAKDQRPEERPVRRRQREPDSAEVNSKAAGDRDDDRDNDESKAEEIDLPRPARRSCRHGWGTERTARFSCGGV